MKLRYCSVSRTLVVIFLFSCLISCSIDDKIEIGFLIPASDGYRWPTDQKFVEKFAFEKGVSVITRSAENDENIQLKQAIELLKSGIDVLIVVAVNANTAAAIVRAAHQFNVPVIGYDRLIKNSDLDYLVTFDGKMIGELMVNSVLKEAPSGNYVMLWGDAGDVNAIFIKEAQENILEPYIKNGKVNIVYKAYIENWSTENSYHVMKKILDLSDQKIDAVITSYDGIAYGAIKALTEFGQVKNIPITGQDAELGALHSLIEGKMSMTIYKPTKNIASESVDLAIKLANGDKITNIHNTINNGRRNVPTLFLTPQVVTKENIRETVIKDGYYIESQVFKN